MLALQAPAQLLRNNLPAVAGDVIPEPQNRSTAAPPARNNLQRLQQARWAGTASTRISILSTPAHHRAVTPSTSLTHAEITAALVQVRDAIDRAIDCGMVKLHAVSWQLKEEMRAKTTAGCV